MPNFSFTDGEDLDIEYLNRDTGGRSTSIMRCTGKSGVTSIAVNTNLAVVGNLAASAVGVIGDLGVGGKLTQGGKLALVGNAFRKLVAVGRNGAGAVTFAGTKVGDELIFALNLSDLADVTSSFEAAVTVAGQIQQSAATDLSAKTILFLLAKVS